MGEIDAREQEQQIGTAQLDAYAVVVGRPGERATLQAFVQDPEAAPVPRQDLDPVAESNDIPHTDRRLSSSNTGGTLCMVNACLSFDGQDVEVVKLSTSK